MNRPQIVETARLIARDPEGRVICFIRPQTSKSRAGDLDIGGGKVDAGEQPRETAVREFQEETGVVINFTDQPIDEQLTFVYGVSDKDPHNGVWYTRNYYELAGVLAVGAITKLSEHDAMVCLTPQTAIEITEFVPHQRALACIS